MRRAPALSALALCPFLLAGKQGFGWLRRTRLVRERIESCRYCAAYLYHAYRKQEF
jgi:integral membrane sensor domain MASE1